MTNHRNWKAIAATSALCLAATAALFRPASPPVTEIASTSHPVPVAETPRTFLSRSPGSADEGGPRLVSSQKGSVSFRDEASPTGSNTDSGQSVPELLVSWRSALAGGGTDLALLYLSIQQGLETSATDPEFESSALIAALSEMEIPVGERGHLASLVGESTSKAGTMALLDLAGSEDEELASLARQGLETIGLRPERNLDQSEAVVDMLEARFHELQGAGGIGAGAVALAQIGTPRAVEFLLEYYARPHSGEMVGALNRAFSRVRNPDAAPVLGEHLRHGDLDEPKTEVSGFALANMSSARASGMLGEWAIHAKEEDSAYAAYLFQLASRGEASLEMLESYAEIEMFESEEVKRRLESVVQSMKLAR